MGNSELKIRLTLEQEELLDKHKILHIVNEDGKVYMYGGQDGLIGTFPLKQPRTIEVSRRKLECTNDCFTCKTQHCV